MDKISVEACKVLHSKLSREEHERKKKEFDGMYDNMFKKLETVCSMLSDRAEFPFDVTPAMVLMLSGLPVTYKGGRLKEALDEFFFNWMSGSVQDSIKDNPLNSDVLAWYKFVYYGTEWHSDAEANVMQKYNEMK